MRLGCERWWYSCTSLLLCQVRSGRKDVGRRRRYGMEVVGDAHGGWLRRRRCMKQKCWMDRKRPKILCSEGGWLQGEREDGERKRDWNKGGWEDRRIWMEKTDAHAGTHRHVHMEHIHTRTRWAQGTHRVESRFIYIHLYLYLYLLQDIGLVQVLISLVIEAPYSVCRSRTYSLFFFCLQIS